jgi:hypothetical protein
MSKAAADITLADRTASGFHFGPNDLGVFNRRGITSKRIAQASEQQWSAFRRI